MRRSKFIKSSFIAGLAVTSGASALGGVSNNRNTGETFTLNYAPHQGMFENHAVPNFLDQIRFMHEHGFRTIEDNRMLKRSLEEQKQIGDMLQKLRMQMGVFVIDGGL